MAHKATSLPSGLVTASMVVAGVMATPVMAYAMPGFTQPTGLLPGQGYRLAFVTNDSIAATSSGIADYNSFVMSEAALNAALPMTTWSALVSTASIAAASNVTCPVCGSVPIYLVDGTELATSTVAFFADNVLNPLEVNQFGANNGNSYVFTGSTSSGQAVAGSTAGAANTEVGITGFQNGLDAGFALPSTNQFPVYALSAEVFVPATAVPEPSSAALLLGGGALVTWLRRRRRA